MSIELIPVSIENWYDCTGLKVKQEQTGVFPAPVVYWIAESKFVHDYELRAICSGALPVGHRPENRIAGNLYESLGFLRVSEEIIEGEVIRLLQLN